MSCITHFPGCQEDARGRLPPRPRAEPLRPEPPEAPGRLPCQGGRVYIDILMCTYIYIYIYNIYDIRNMFLYLCIHIRMQVQSPQKLRAGSSAKAVPRRPRGDTYIYIYLSLSIYIYIYIIHVCISLSLCIYIYIYTHTYAHKTPARSLSTCVSVHIGGGFTRSTHARAMPELRCAHSVFTTCLQCVVLVAMPGTCHVGYLAL